MALRLSTAALVGQTTVDRTARRTRRMTRGRRRGEPLTEQGGQPFTSGCSILPLRSRVGGHDDQDRSGQSRPQSTKQALALLLVEGRRDSHVEGQLNPRISRVHALPTGAGRMGVPLDQLAFGDRQPCRQLRRRRNPQLLHTGNGRPWARHSRKRTTDSRVAGRPSQVTCRGSGVPVPVPRAGRPPRDAGRTRVCRAGSSSLRTTVTPGPCRTRRSR